jgi:hypothetical protein
LIKCSDIRNAAGFQDLIERCCPIKFPWSLVR